MKFNFSEQDLNNANKKSNAQKIKNKVNENFNNIMNGKPAQNLPKTPSTTNASTSVSTSVMPKANASTSVMPNVNASVTPKMTASEMPKISEQSTIKNNENSLKINTSSPANTTPATPKLQNITNANTAKTPTPTAPTTAEKQRMTASENATTNANEKEKETANATTSDSKTANANASVSKNANTNSNDGGNATTLTSDSVKEKENTSVTANAISNATNASVSEKVNSTENEKQTQNPSDGGNATPTAPAEEAVTDLKTAYEKLLEQLAQIDEQYQLTPTKGDQVDTELNLQRKEYETKTDEELKQEAEQYLSDYKTQSLNALESLNNAKIASLENQKADATASANADKISVEQYYQDAKRQAEYDALKRGLQRSSIVINNLNAFDTSKVAKLMQIDKALGDEIADLTDEITALNLQKEQALADFNMEYALKVSEKIAELQKEIQDRNDEILEYNNKIAQIEAEYKQSAQKDNNATASDYLSDLVKYAENKGLLESVKTDAYTKTIDNYLNSLSKADALAELQNNQYIKELLGTNYAYFVYKTNQRQD